MLSYHDLSPPGLRVRVGVAEVILVYPGLSQQDGAVVKRAAGSADVGGTSFVQADVRDCFAGVCWFRSLNRNIWSQWCHHESCVVFRPVEETAEGRSHLRDLSPARCRYWCPSLSTPAGEDNDVREAV